MDVTREVPHFVVLVDDDVAVAPSARRTKNQRENLDNAAVRANPCRLAVPDLVEVRTARQRGFQVTRQRGDGSVVGMALDLIVVDADSETLDQALLVKGVVPTDLVHDVFRHSYNLPRFELPAGCRSGQPGSQLYPPIERQCRDHTRLVPNVGTLRYNWTRQPTTTTGGAHS